MSYQHDLHRLAMLIEDLDAAANEPTLAIQGSMAAMYAEWARELFNKLDSTQSREEEGGIVNRRSVVRAILVAVMLLGGVACHSSSSAPATVVCRWVPRPGFNPETGDMVPVVLVRVCG